MALLFEQLVRQNTAEFIAEVKNISQWLGIEPGWLMAVMYKESGINHQAVNARSGATGLIQFMPSTAISLGTTTQKLREMTNVQQLKYVKAYLAPYRNRMKSYEDVYLTVFFPVAIGKPNDWVIRTPSLSADTVAKANSVIDLNKDGQITVAEFNQYCLKGFTSGTIDMLKKK